MAKFIDAKGPGKASAAERKKLRESAMRGLPLFSQVAFGQTPELFGKADIAVTLLAGDELGLPQATRKMAMDWARTHIQGLRESFAHSASLPQQALAALLKLIERAALAETTRTERAGPILKRCVISMHRSILGKREDGMPFSPSTAPDIRHSRATPPTGPAPDPSTPEGSAEAVNRIGEAMRAEHHG